MKAKTRLKLIAVLAIAMGVSLICGCSIGFPGLQETIDSYYSVVTYYGNGGYFDESSILYMYAGFEEESKFYDIQPSDTAVTILASSQYTFGGWYYIETVEIDGEDYYVCEDDTVAENYTITLNEETRVVVTENGGDKVISRDDYEQLTMRYATSVSDVPILKLGDKVDTDSVLPEGHTYVAASWYISQGIEYRLVGTDSITYTTSAGETVTVNEGEVIYTAYYGTSSSLTVLMRSPIFALASTNTMTNGTWLEEYYTDENCTEAIATGTRVTKPASGNVVIYAKYMSGVWELLRDSSDVVTMFGENGSKNYYLYCDIDCTGVTAGTRSTFGGTFEGNGHTISNLTISKTRLSTGTYTSMFGTLNGDATIQNVTFDNLSVSFSAQALSGNYLYMYLICSRVATGTEPSISNVKITNSEFSITAAEGTVTVGNIQGSSTSNWLYGITGDISETDADFEAAYGGFTLSGVTLKYNDTIIAEISAE